MHESLRLMGSFWPTRMTNRSGSVEPLPSTRPKASKWRWSRRREGSAGGPAKPEANPGLAALGQIREAELRAAATALGIDRLTFLDQIDGELAQAESSLVLARIVAEIRAFRPQVVVTFGPDGVYGHPDHVAISQLTTAGDRAGGRSGISG